MTTTANGKAALALLDDDTVSALADREARAGDGASRPPAEIIAEIRRVRATGLAWDLDEHTDGISAVGAAFRDPNGTINAISIPVPSHRFAARKTTLAKVLSEALGKVDEVFSQR